MKTLIQNLILFLLIVSSFPSLISCYSDTENELILTQSEKLILDKFKERVLTKLPHEYMKHELYLVRWLRARQFNLDGAEQMLNEHLEWRIRHNMDNVLKENWKDLEADFRYAIEGCDKEGRPVVSAYLGDWDARKAFLSGQGPRLSRYIDKLVEEVTTLVRKSGERGQNITQFSLILDLKNYNLAQHACGGCIALNLQFMRTLQQHYPGTIHKLHVINTPAIFQPVLLIMKPLLSERARKILYFYGQDKREWQSALLKDSSKEKLTRALGGEKDTPFEMEHFKEIGYFECESPKPTPVPKLIVSSTNATISSATNSTISASITAKANSPVS